MKKTNRIYWIAGGIIILSVGVAVANKLSKSSKILQSDKDGIISQASKLIGSPKVVFLFGGLHYATPEWMFSQIPVDTLKNYTFVIVPYDVSIQKAYDFYKAVSGKSLDYEDMILLGYSAGAKRVQEGYSSDYKLVGLIDPSTDHRLSQKSYGKNTIMIYNPDNWSGLPIIQRKFPALKENIIGSGGRVEQLDLPHKEFVKYFFENYM